MKMNKPENINLDRTSITLNRKFYFVLKSFCVFYSFPFYLFISSSEPYAHESSL